MEREENERIGEQVEERRTEKKNKCKEMNNKKKIITLFNVGRVRFAGKDHASVLAKVLTLVSIDSRAAPCTMASAAAVERRRFIPFALSIQNCDS